MKHVTSLFILAAAFVAAAADNPDKLKYVLGPGDQIMVQVVELPEFGARPYRVDADGSVGLPLVGRIRAEGLTLGEFETEVATGLKRQVLHPHLFTSVSEPRSSPVSVMGAVNTPGAQQLHAGKTLFDVLAAAGGPKPEAGTLVTITRQKNEGPLALPNAIEDPSTGRTTAAVRLRDIVELRDPAANIVVQPHDEISVGRAPVLYVIGNVRKAGGFTLSEGRSVSALEALSLAEGLAPNASPKNARILRKTGTDNTAREQIPINLKDVLSGKKKDVELTAGDILFIPDNISRRAATRTLETALNTISGVAIWRGF
jgi:polysaccharide export outer membrane protein